VTNSPRAWSSRGVCLRRARSGTAPAVLLRHRSGTSPRQTARPPVRDRPVPATRSDGHSAALGLRGASRVACHPVRRPPMSARPHPKRRPAAGNARFPRNPTPRLPPALRSPGGLEIPR